MTDRQPFYAPNLKPKAPRRPRPLEPIWSVRRATDGARFDCGLLDHGRHGVDLQLFRNEEFASSRRFPSRELARQWAEHVRQHIEGGASAGGSARSEDQAARSAP